MHCASFRDHRHHVRIGRHYRARELCGAARECTAPAVRAESPRAGRSQAGGLAAGGDARAHPCLLGLRARWLAITHGRGRAAARHDERGSRQARCRRGYARREQSARVRRHCGAAPSAAALGRRRRQRTAGRGVRILGCRQCAATAAAPCASNLHDAFSATSGYRRHRLRSRWVHRRRRRAFLSAHLRLDGRAKGDSRDAPCRHRAHPPIG